MTNKKESIKDLIKQGRIDEAISMLNELIDAYAPHHCSDDELFYLRGNAYRKKSDWQQALNNYLEAIALNPDSPALQAHKMLMEILEFYNKDMYNQ